MIKKSHKFCSILCMASIFFYILISSSLCFGASEAKGIEFDKVFVIPNKMSKNEKYIAYTRALLELVIVVDENIIDQEAQEEYI